MFNLTQITQLDLSHNQLEGPQPNHVSELQLLEEFSLSNNPLSGGVPSWLFSLPSLLYLDLGYNKLTGPMEQIKKPNSVETVYLSSNEIHGPIPSSSFDLANLNTLDLSSNNLSGLENYKKVFTSFLNLTSSLESLSLRVCQLNGEFPTEVFQLPNLHHIDLGGNQNLTGYLPKTNLSRALKSLDLQYCGFRGSIPASFGNLTQIMFIDLSKNSFGGQIPDVFLNLNKLTSLRFHSCNFSGQLPTSMFNLTQITQLDLSHNQLEGPLPNHVSELQLLEEFSLSNNSLSGGVPSWLFSLPFLLNLDISYNKLTGPIGQIQKPNSVQTVYLSSNEIHGPIPSFLFDLVNLSALDLSSNNLSGVIESYMLSKLKNLKCLDLSNNSLLSLSTSVNDVNYSFPQLAKVFFSSCSIRQFPNFFRTSKLKVLDLSINKISGEIFKWEAEGWEQLTKLNLSYNFLTSLEQFPGKNLEVLDLQSNFLQGPILSTCLNPQISNPPQFLSVFLISENNLTGNIPSLICNWPSLALLDLSKNSLSGTIPECLGNLSYSLQFMNLQMNNFYGKIPDSFMNNMLINLFLNDNQLEGSLPRSLANCSSLEVLNLGNNKLTDTFPHWLAPLPRLQVLILRFNRLHGSIPNSISLSNFSALRIIDLSRNELTGPLPTILFQNLRAMKDVPRKRSPESFFYNIGGFIGSYGIYKYHTSVNITTKRLEIELVKTLAMDFVAMDFSNNLFCGQIPEELGGLISLQMLNFSHNNFTGPIPPSLGNVIALESLDLSSNKLGGRIPSQLTNLTFLAVLNLTKNNLVGPIPHGNQFDTFDNDSYSGNLGLCGLPLSKQCGNQEGSKPPAPICVEHDNCGIPFIWKVAMMGYGCGVVLGLSIGYIVFTTGRPWWIVRMIERDWQKNVTKWIRRNGRRKN
ncbi:hypothetical protein REPUB_Repub11eG0038900 [Reevesia pubescens]